VRRLRSIVVAVHREQGAADVANRANVGLQVVQKHEMVGHGALCRGMGVRHDLEELGPLGATVRPNDAVGARGATAFVTKPTTRPVRPPPVPTPQQIHTHRVFPCPPAASPAHQKEERSMWTARLKRRGERCRRMAQKQNKHGGGRR